MTVDAGDLVVERARIKTLRRGLGAHLAIYRQAAGVSQPQLAQALGRTRSAISKVEHGTRGMPARLWKLADDVCRADGALIAEHNALAEAEQDYRGRCRAQRRAARQAAAQVEIAALQGSLGPAIAGAVSSVARDDGWSDQALVHGQLAEEFLAVFAEVARVVGRRRAMRMAGWAAATMSLSDVDPEEYVRVARAVACPGRVDTQVISNLAGTLTLYKRLEDKLGPCEVFDAVLAQHGIVRRLLAGSCPERLRKSLHLLDSNMASAIGGYLIDMGHLDTARGYFERARKAAHDAGNPTYAAYAAAWTSSAAFLRRDTPAALDSAAAARSLATRTDDPQLKALAEQMAAAAYALDGQHGPFVAASARAHEHLTHANGSVTDSPAYWVHHGTVDSQRSTYLCLLDKPKQAVEAAVHAQTRFDRNYVIGYAHCQIRLGHALVLDKEIAEAVRVLGDAADLAPLLSPRLAGKLRTTRALLQPWANTQAVKTLDAQLEAHGLLPAHPATSAPAIRRPGQRT